MNPNLSIHFVRDIIYERFFFRLLRGGVSKNGFGYFLVSIQKLTTKIQIPSTFFHATVFLSHTPYWL